MGNRIFSCLFVMCMLVVAGPFALQSKAADKKVKWLHTKVVWKGYNMITTTEYAYNEKGKLISQKDVSVGQGNKNEIMTEMVYDENMHMVKRIRNMKNSSGYSELQEVIVETDNKGLPIKEISTVTSNRTKFQMLDFFEYDEEGRVIKKKTISPGANGQPSEVVVVNEYDHCGKLHKILTQRSGSSSVVAFKREYGENCNPLSELMMLDNRVMNKRMYKYGANGKMIESELETLDRSGKVIKTQSSKEHYDANGNQARTDSIIVDHIKNKTMKTVTEVEYVSFKMD